MPYKLHTERIAKKNRNPYKDDGSLKWYVGPAITICATIFLLSILLFYYVGMPQILRWLITRETCLLNGTDTWEKWRNVSMPIFISFYFFNVTNPDAVALNHSKFGMEEVGPYVWEEKRAKQILSVDEKEDTVSYQEIVWYYFRPDLSVGSQEDKVNVVNIPFYNVALSAYKKLYSFLANEFIDHFMEEENETMVLQGVKIRDLMFDGVQLKPIYGDLSSLESTLPSEFYNGTFAFFNKRNGTPSAEYAIFRGVTNHAKFGEILTYDRQNEVSWWTSPSFPAKQEQYCNKINGSDGSVFPPFVTKDQRLYIFSSEVCRSVFLVFDRELDFHGIPAYQFKLPKQTEGNPDNACFCPDQDDGLENRCDHGTFRLSTCKGGAPIALSHPQFVDAPANISDGVLEIKPKREALQTEFVIEPTSGAVLQISKRLQINLEYQRLPDISAFADVTYTQVPVFWAEESAVQDEATIERIRFRLVTGMEIVCYIIWSLVGIAAIIGFVGIGLTVVFKKQEELSLAIADKIIDSNGESLRFN